MTNATIYYDTQVRSNHGWVCETDDDSKSQYQLQANDPDATDEELIREGRAYADGDITIRRSGDFIEVDDSASCEPQSGSLRSAARQAVIDAVAVRAAHEHQRNFHKLHIYRDGHLRWSEHINQSDDIIDSRADQFGPIPSVACVGTGTHSCNCEYCNEVYSATDEAYAIEQGEEYDKSTKYADRYEAIADAVANADLSELEADMLAQLDAIEIGYFDDEEKN